MLFIKCVEDLKIERNLNIINKNNEINVYDMPDNMTLNMIFKNFIKKSTPRAVHNKRCSTNSCWLGNFEVFLARIFEQFGEHIKNNNLFISVISGEDNIHVQD